MARGGPVHEALQDVGWVRVPLDEGDHRGVGKMLEQHFLRVRIGGRETALEGAADGGGGWGLEEGEEAELEVADGGRDGLERAEVAGNKDFVSGDHRLRSKLEASWGRRERERESNRVAHSVREAHTASRKGRPEVERERAAPIKACCSYAVRAQRCATVNP